MENKSRYCYDDGVLMNCYDIHDKEALEKLERNVTTFRISQVESGQVVFDQLFSVNSYLQLHRFIFSDIYPFAGEIREEAIYKSSSPYCSGKTSFCYPSFIYQNLSHYLRAMEEDIYKIKDRKVLISYLAYYYGELNMVHPFREGNGRTLRTFLELVVDYISDKLSLGIKLQYSLWSEEDREKLLQATVISSVTADCQMLEECFDKVLVEKNKGRKK